MHRVWFVVEKDVPHKTYQPDPLGSPGDALVNHCSVTPLRSCIFAPSTAHDQFNKYFVQTKVFLLNKLITME